MFAIYILGLVASAYADCVLTNILKGPPPPGDVLLDNRLCVPQGAGAWTFGAYSRQSAVPAPNPDGAGSALAGDVSSSSLILYDNTCTPRALYNLGAVKCGWPLTIMENFLADVMTVTDLQPDERSFTFKYGDGLFTASTLR